MCAYFSIRYRNADLESWLGRHEAFKTSLHAEFNTLYQEMSACLAFGLDPDEYFEKDRETRILVTSFISAKRSLDAMIEYDSRAKEKKRK